MLAVAALGASPALARDPVVAIPATTLDVALAALARQANVEVISTEPGLKSIHTRAVQGEMSPRRALDRLLAGTGYRAVSIGGGYRVVRGVAARRATQPRASAGVPQRAAEPQPMHEIVVTANKQQVPLLRYPGSLTLVEASAAPTPAGGTMTDLAHALPILQSTELGAGRNKVFIRGVADSSFNGSTQSPASIYLDDVQLNYSGPDPGLRLYDMRSVEILEGPQGTLYGSGPIAGVIRLTSNPVDLSAPAARTASGVTMTQHGDPGFDIAGMINLPLAQDRIGLRAVAYRVRDGGYIGDAARGLSNVNRTDTAGGRLAFRFEPGDGWRIEAGGALQSIDTRDGQYADRVEAPLTRRSLIAQPFDNRLLFGRFAVSKEWDSGLRLFSAVGAVGYDSTELFDATPAQGSAPQNPVIYTSAREKRLISEETRLSRSLPDGDSWVVGFTLVRDMDILSRELGGPDMSRSIIGVTNVTRAASIFGETTVALTKAFSLTAGGRLTAARVDGQPSSEPRSANYVKGRSTGRLDPTLALSWVVAPRVALFSRFQTGYRTGGLAVAPGIGRVSDYRSDAIIVGEIGIRKLRAGPTGLALSSSLSLSRWNGIQADLINRRGQPYTANIGDAWIRTIEATIDWAPISGLTVGGAFLFTDNEVSGPIADQSRHNNRRLPETPPFAAHGTLSYRWARGAIAPTLNLTADYVGRSVLGTGDLLDVSQGDYLTFGASVALSWRVASLSISADNLTNRTANRFAFGNPFSLSSRDQVTPLRPRNLRIGLSVAW